MNRKSRPAMLVEMQDARARQWGYAAGDPAIPDSHGLPVVAIAEKGALVPISCEEETYDANLVALPTERTEGFLSLLGQEQGESRRFSS